MQRAVRMLSGLLLALTALSAGAAALQPDAVVQQTTEKVLAIVNEERANYEKAPQRFNERIEQTMAPVVDFDGFARGVMGRYASAQYYKSLQSDAERAAFRKQVERFTTTFRRGVIDTYAKGLYKFNGQRIETLPGKPGAGGSVTVKQLIHGDAAQPYVVQYTMRADSDGSWRVRNVVVEGINLGQTYRNQFATAMQQNKNDIDRVIDNWRVEPDATANANNGAAN